MTNPDIVATAKRCLELDKEVELGPWHVKTYADSAFSDVVYGSEGHVLINDIVTETAALIAEYRTAAPLLAQSLLTAIEALRDIYDMNPQMTKYGNARPPEAIRAREALAKMGVK